MINSRQWQWVLLGVTAVYLLAEFAFNVRLVDNATTTNEGVIRSLEYWGRSIAATGCVVALLRLLSFKFITTKIPLCAALLLSAWVVVFFAQKLLIDWYVNSSSDTQKLDAWHITLFKRGLDNGAIQLDGLDTSSGHHARDKTLLSLLGLIGFSRPEYVQMLKGRSEEIAVSIADTQAVEDVDRLYEGFLKIREGLEVKYQAGLKAQKLAREYPPVLQRELQQFFTERRRCNSEARPYVDRCFSGIDAEYEKRIIGMVGKLIEWKAFCIPSSASTTYQLRAGQLQAVKSDHLDCDNIPADRIEKILLQALGIKYRFDDWSQFSRLPRVQNVIQEKLELSAAVDLDMTKAGFLDMVVTPKYRKQVLEERDRWLALNITEEQGRQAVRAVVVHPIALAFSLFFSVLNLVGLVGGVGRVARNASFGHSLTVVSTGVILSIPLLYSGSDYSFYQYLEAVEIEEFGYVVRWVMVVEPWVYKLFGGFL